MKNSADLGGCYPSRPSASVDNTLLYLQNSSYPTQPHSIIANYSPPTEWIMRKPNKSKMAGVNSRFASVPESIFNGFLLKMLLRSLLVYILKQLFFSISVNSGRIIVNYCLFFVLCDVSWSISAWPKLYITTSWWAGRHCQLYEFYVAHQSLRVCFHHSAYF